MVEFFDVRGDDHFSEYGFSVIISIVVEKAVKFKAVFGVHEEAFLLGSEVVSITAASGKAISEGVD